MIIDTSIIMTMLLDEPEAGEAYNILSTVDKLKISAGTLIECSVVVHARLGKKGHERLYQTLKDANVSIIPVSQSHADLAQGGFVRYGKGQQNKASLNFGDLFAYALAKESGEALLCKGNDFIHTDIEVIRLGDTAS